MASRKSRWIKINGERLHGLHYWSSLDDGRLLVDTHVLMPGPGEPLDERRVASLSRPIPFADAPEGTVSEVDLELHDLRGPADYAGRRIVAFASSWVRRDGPRQHWRIDRYVVWPEGESIDLIDRERLDFYRRLARVETVWNAKDTGVVEADARALEADMRAVMSPQGDYMSIEDIRANALTPRA